MDNMEKLIINQKAAQTWLPAVEKSDLALTSPVFRDSKKPAPSRAEPRAPISSEILGMFAFPVRVWERLSSSQAFKI